MRQQKVYGFWLALLVIMGLGAWARWQYIQAEAFHVDEFISMLAIKMILEKGQPILPSGLFYDHGLVFSYLGAITAWLAGGELLAARWWSLIAGTLSIGVCYVLTWRLYGVHGWGLIAALGLALNQEAIKWGGRVRMYSQANLLLLLWILLLWLGVSNGKRRWPLAAFLIALWLGVNTHLVLLLALPPMVIALAIVWGIHHRGKIPWRATLRSNLTELVMVGIMVVIIGWGAQTSFVARHTVDPTPDSTTAAENTNPGSDVLVFALSADRWNKMGQYFSAEALRPFVILAVVGAGAAIAAIAWRRANRVDLAALFIALMLLGLRLEFLLLVADQWHQDRYRFLLLLPLLLVLSAYGLRVAVYAVTRLTRRLIPDVPWVSRFSAVIAVCLFAVWPMRGPWQTMLTASAGESNTPNQYNLAFEYVDSRRGPQDQLVALQAAAGYIYSRSYDYYVNYTTPVIIPGPNGWVDGYAGVPYLGNMAQLDQVIAKPGKMWLVIDQDQLYSKLEPVFTQHLLNRTEVIHQIGNILILSESDTIQEVLPIAPAQPTSTFMNNIQLVGYAIASPLSKGQQIELVTFWQNMQFVDGYKVFVHLRNPAGQTIAQADFAPLDQIDPRLRDRLMAEGNRNEQGQFRTILTVPPDIPDDSYNLYVGIYNVTTNERLPVMADSSGENAVFLGKVNVR